VKQRAPRAGRHPARRVALQTLFEIDFNRADAKETWQRGSFRTGLTDEAASFAWQLVEGVLEHRKALD
jgi:transcription termination factor NusB